MKKMFFAVVAALTMTGICTPVFADTFTSEDGVLSIELPGENWVEIVDPDNWIALSDGTDVITIEHFSNGEKLPEFTVADSNYAQVVEAAFSTLNEVFIVTGQMTDSSHISAISEAVASVKILKYDTKTAVKQQESAGEYTVEPVDKTMYVTTEGLNVRTGCSVDDQIIGDLSYGDSVHVVGKVRRNGEDITWVQIAYASGTAYVSSKFLSDEKPKSSSGSGTSNESKSETTDDSSSDTNNGDDDNDDGIDVDINYSVYYKLYNDETGETFSVGGWDDAENVYYDSRGTEYHRVEDGIMQDENQNFYIIQGRY